MQDNARRSVVNYIVKKYKRCIVKTHKTCDSEVQVRERAGQASPILKYWRHRKSRDFRPEVTPRPRVFEAVRCAHHYRSDILYMDRQRQNSNIVIILCFFLQHPFLATILNSVATETGVCVTMPFYPQVLINKL